MSKKVLFILGMHRSGTSALAGAIHHSGIAGGQALIDPAFDNVKGFFESQSAVQINEAILAEWGLSWDSPFTLPSGWATDSLMQKHKNAIRHFLETELTAQSIIYLKDPRLCYVLPLWQEVMAALEIEAHYVLTLRRPEEICRSLKRRNDMDRNKALSLWLDYSLLAEKNTRHSDRLFVAYSQLLEAPLETIEPILKAFQLLPDPQHWQQQQPVIRAFIDKKLKHHEAAQTGFNADLLPYYGQTAALLQQLIASPEDPATLARLDEIREAYAFNLSFFAPAAKKEHFATLKIADSKSARMEAPLKIPVYAGLSEVVFHLGRISNTPVFHVFPCNEVSLVSLHGMRIRYEDGSTDTIASPTKKALLEHGNDFLFGKEDFIVVEPDAAKKPECIVLDIRYQHIGEAAMEAIHDLGGTIKAWLYEQLKEKEAEAVRQADEWSGKLQAAQGFSANLEREKEAAAQEFALQKQFLQAQIRQAEGQIQEAEEQIRQLEAQAQQSQTAIQQFEAQIQNLQTQVIPQLEAQTRGLEEQAMQLQGQLTQTLDTLQHSEVRHRQTQEKLQITAANAAALKAKTETEQREIAALKQKIKEKDALIWDVYSKSQKAEQDYRQALRNLEDVKTSVSYRLGWLLTAPLRFGYDVFQKKPINETGMWLSWQFVVAGLKMPGRMLSQINGTNIRTLRKALANESPREITGNLMKLLSGNRNASSAPTLPHSSPAAAPAMPAVVGFSTEPPAATNGTHTPKSPEPDWSAQGRKVVIFCAPHLPDFDGSSGGKRATRMLALLAEDCEVYAFSLGTKPEKYVRKLEESGVRVFRSNDFEEIKTLVPRADALIFSFFYSYFDCEKLMHLYRTAKVIVDSVDVHWVRHERSRGLWADLTDDIIQKKKALEIEVYRNAEIVWTVTEQDRQAVLAEAPEAEVRIVSNVHNPETIAYHDPGNKQLLFIGGFAHYPNIIAVRELVFNVFPKIKEQVEDAILVIAGSNAPQDIVDLGKLPGVEFLGFVEDSLLPDLYKNTFLALAPLQAGAGIKGKICEAIAFRIPVVTNSIGNEGIDLLNEESGLVSDDNDELVRLTVKALRREYDLDKMTRLAQSRLHHLVGPETVKKNMLASLSSEEISICIVTWNKLELLQRCIESIEKNTQGIRYKILVWSNGCTDGTQQYLEAAAKINPDIVPILSKTNEVFVIPNNRMIKRYPQNDVVLLNNDTYVTEGWLSALRDAAYASEDIGITGAKLLYPDGRLQEFGSELYANGTGRNIGKFDDPDKEEYQFPKFAGYVSGCVFYVKRSTIEQIGVFDEAFHPCYCEDSDYCYTAWENGIATLVTPDCVVYHDEGSTSGTDTSTGFKAYQKVNFEKFLGKHGGRLEEMATRIKLKNLSALHKQPKANKSSQTQNA